MDMVLARAAKIGAASKTEAGNEEKVKEGMRTAAGYLRGEVSDLKKILAAQPPAERSAVQKGMVLTFLRNIVLPREKEQQEPAEKAMQGLLELGEGGGLAAVFGEMKKILEQYLQHRQQLRQQLESQFAQQMEMMEQSLAQQTGMAMKLQPAQHPKFQEEWQRITGELNDQYGRALDQYKNHIKQQLGA